jgi:membrane associated rhomboid family serine protease
MSKHASVIIQNLRDHLPSLPYLTIAASLISTYVSIAWWRTPNCDIPCGYHFGLSDLEFIYGGGFWKIYTSAFVHTNWAHLIGNLIFLWAFGKRVEQAFGHRIWVILFLISVPVGFASVVIVEGAPAAGISGFIFAMFGYLLLADRQETVWRTLTARKLYIAFVIFIFLTLIPVPPFLGLGEFRAAHEAHFFCFLEGLLVGNLLWRPKTVWSTVGAAILPILAAASFLYNPSSFWWQMAKDHDDKILSWQNLALLSCEFQPLAQTDVPPKYLPIIVNPKHTRYHVVVVDDELSTQAVKLFIIDYESLTVHNAGNTTMKYANLYDTYIGQLFEIRNDAEACLGRFKVENDDYNIIVLK